jgi:hypothetical protein
VESERRSRYGTFIPVGLPGATGGSPARVGGRQWTSIAVFPFGAVILLNEGKLPEDAKESPFYMTFGNVVAGAGNRCGTIRSAVGESRHLGENPESSGEFVGPTLTQG